MEENDVFNLSTSLSSFWRLLSPHLKFKSEVSSVLTSADFNAFRVKLNSFFGGEFWRGRKFPLTTYESSTDQYKPSLSTKVDR